MSDTLRYELKIRILTGIAILAVAGTLLVDPVAQDPAYHNFADQHSVWGIPHCWNVLSNIPFTLVGIMGFWLLLGHPPGVASELRLAYGVFFAGVTLVGFGSSWYHLAPSNATLVWDRLPMTVAFMAFFAVIVAENISMRAGRRLLWPLIVTGFASVAWWHVTEIQGAGDLRPYALVQFLPILLIPLILLLFLPSYSHRAWLWLVMATYGLSKLAEYLDAPIYELLGGFSGHSLKHLLAALGPLALLMMLKRRRAIAAAEKPGTC